MQETPGIHTFTGGKSNRKFLAWLIDPDKGASPAAMKGPWMEHVDFIFVGGSLLTGGEMRECILQVKKHCPQPVVIFPGHGNQICADADGILLLSLVSGRNPELLIGQHVVSALQLKHSGLGIIPTAYLLIDGGKTTTVSYITQSVPIPADKPEIAAITALAATQLGMKCVYLDAGSGARQPVSGACIAAVRNLTDAFLVAGGGIISIEKARSAWAAGADCLVVGNAIEKNPDFLAQLAEEKWLNKHQSSPSI
jgi:putative glycerol-1-phosphate prenyltransferase